MVSGRQILVLGVYLSALLGIVLLTRHQVRDSELRQVSRNCVEVEKLKAEFVKEAKETINSLDEFRGEFSPRVLRKAHENALRKLRRYAPSECPQP